jgi:hypothetical protein
MLVILLRLALGRADCSSIGKAGAGATTSLCPMLMSLALRVLVSSTVGGGAMTVACSPGISRFVVIDSTWGGGATTGTGNVGSLGTESEVAESGTLGAAWLHSTTFGNGMSRSSFTFGGATMVCFRLSASGGTDRIGWAE